MSPLSRLLFLVHQRKMFIALYVTRSPQVICTACALSRLRRAAIIAAKVVLVVKQSDNMQGCMDGESLLTANSGFIISSPNSTTGLDRVQFITATWGMVTLTSMHWCTRGRCSISSQCGYETACSKGDDYLC